MPVSTFTWYPMVEKRLQVVIPQQAHLLASSAAAGIGAKAIHSKATGTLARDISRVRHVGMLNSFAGSDLPYALMEDLGGTISPKRGEWLYIRGTGGRRSTTGGEIVARARSVVHQPKHWRRAAAEAYVGLMMAQLRRMMPG